jgi:hypothetical protein
MNSKYLIFFITIAILLLYIYFNFNSKKKTFVYIESNGNIIDLSRRLTDSMKRIGQLTCEKSSKDVSTNGGWCSKISGANSTQHITDKRLATTLSNFLKGKTVASFGDGPGLYKKLISEKREVILYDSFDGAPYCEETTDGRVQFLDLSVPIYHLKQYDWIVSLEVAEHIPQEYESIYLDNLAKHASEGIILSWARIGQGGHSHVNNRDFDYVKKQVEKRGFKHDLTASNILKSGTNLAWIQNNVNVFIRKFEDDVKIY